jgi:RimJ/RimL family protein N-acetyltransferase
LATAANAVTFPVAFVETARLILRVPELADAEAFMDVFWDPEVVERKQVTLLEPPGGLDLALKNTSDMRRQWETRGYGQWAVVEKATGEVIGCVGLYHPQRPWPGVDLGWVVHRSRWGHGLATEAATAALGWAWAHTQIDRILSLIAPHDRRSIRVATKLGARFERADVDPVNGEPAHVYAIIRPLDPTPAA